MHTFSGSPQSYNDARLPSGCIVISHLKDFNDVSVAAAGALGDKEDRDEKEKKGDGGEDDDEEEAIAEARREEEEKRKEKHRKMEEDREKMRQEIRDQVFTTGYISYYR